MALRRTSRDKAFASNAVVASATCGTKKKCPRVILATNPRDKLGICLGRYSRPLVYPRVKEEAAGLAVVN